MRVWEEKKVDRTAIGQDVPHMVAADTQYSLWQNENSVKLTFAEMVTGKPREYDSTGHLGFVTDKRRWYRWRTTGSYGFIRSKNGFAVPYASKRGLTMQDRWQARSSDQTFNIFLEESDKGDAFRRAMWEVFGIRDIQGIYPAMKIWDMDNYKGIPENLKRSFREPTIGAFTVETFGVRRVKNRMMSAVRNSDPYLVALAHQARGLTPDHILQDFLLMTNLPEEFEIHSPRVRELLKLLDPQAVDSLFTKPFTYEDMLRVKDLDRSINHTGVHKYWMSKFTKGCKFKSWEDIYRNLYNRDVYVPVGYLSDDGVAS